MEPMVKANSNRGATRIPVEMSFGEATVYAVRRV